MTERPHAGRSILDAASDLSRDLPELLRKELSLLKAEASHKLSEMAKEGTGLLIGLLIEAIALLVLVQALVIALAEYMPAWVASLIVGIILAAIGLVMVLKGQRGLRAASLVPEHSMESLRRDKQMVEEKLR